MRNMNKVQYARLSGRAFFLVRKDLFLEEII